ncbi:putative beta-lactamase HcpC precursor [mine drainage metagenome]|uniref:Putative beta-lactamase HcpC n=1 Tax=mine drainage metagenome TaxID=410659 RepID=A0A1J5PDQ7_9ZZZZ
MDALACVSLQRELAEALGSGMQHKRRGSFEAAAQAFSVAAQGGNAVAEYQLGCLYLHGHGVFPDHAQVAYWWERSAAQGYVKALACLGTFYKKENGAVPANPSKAAELLGAAAAKRHAIAQYQLADMYARGHGVARDLEQASELFRQSAEQGCGPAQYRLGLCYADGLGVRPDLETAAYWLQRAANQGCAPATASLSRLLQRTDADAEAT